MTYVSLQDLPLDILLEISKFHPWVGCELAKTVRKVGLYSLENDVKKWFKVEEDKGTFILVKSTNFPSYHKRLFHSWDDAPAIIGCYGHKYWYKLGRFHRNGDKPSITYPNGGQEYHKEGKWYYHP